MRSSILRTSTRTFLSSTRMTAAPSSTAQLQKTADMSTSTSTFTNANAKDLDIKSTNINTAPGVQLSSEQKVIVGSVLDLFRGLPTLPKLSLWTEDATFSDPLTQSKGRKQYSAQWYGLAAAFSEIEQLRHEVTGSGNPIEVNLKMRYKMKGVGVEKVVGSVVRIHMDDEGRKITGVEDRWDGEIPEGAFAKVFRNLNAVMVPAFVNVPKTEEEEAKKGK